jgi:diguanylate cyclase (GGDEF)-like protein
MEETLKALLAALPVGVLLLDRQGRIVIANPAAVALVGLSDNAVGVSLFGEPAIATELRELEAVLASAITGDAAPLDVDREFSQSTPAGSRELRARLRRVMIAGEPHGLLLVDDNERFKRAGRALDLAKDLAVRDPLTGLFNRRHVEGVLPAEIGRAERLGSPLSLLIIDLDHFKVVNDRHGHPMGDRVLVELARLLNRILRVGDTSARLGGEEFCVVLQHSDSAAALGAADRLHRVIRALRFQEEPDLRITVSIGIATARPIGPGSDHAGQAARLLAEADKAMYAAKHGGRDCTQVAPE